MKYWTTFSISSPSNLKCALLGKDKMYRVWNFPLENCISYLFCRMKWNWLVRCVFCCCLMINCLLSQMPEQKKKQSIWINNTRGKNVKNNKTNTVTWYQNQFLSFWICSGVVQHSHLYLIRIYKRGLEDIPLLCHILSQVNFLSIFVFSKIDNLWRKEFM